MMPDSLIPLSLRPTADLQFYMGKPLTTKSSELIRRDHGAASAEKGDGTAPLTDFFDQVGAAAVPIAIRRLPAVLASYNAACA
jgi:hypothetical protein